MKKNFIIAITAASLSVGTTVCNAQAPKRQQTIRTQTALQNPVYEQDKVDQKAEFPGGAMKQLEFIMHNVKYPQEAEKKGVSGVVRVHFIVETDGSLADVKVPESVHPALDAEGIRLVKAMPKWTPAKLKGKAVRSKMVIAIPFRLN